MTNSFLTPLQQAFLRAFFADPVGQRFFLTGGTALAAFHLQHRLSDDLDLFTLDDLALEAAVRSIEIIAADLDCTLQRTRVSQYFQQFLLTHPHHETPLKIDAVQDFGPQYGERFIRDEIIGKMIAESDEDIRRVEAAGKEKEIDRLISKASMSTLGKVVTPAVKADIRRRLDQLSCRLQREGQSQRASSLAALLQILDFPAFPWVLFGPVRQAFDDAVREFVGGLLIHTAISKAAGVPIAELTPKQMANLLADPTVRQRFETLREQDKTLREVMDSQFDRAYKEFLHDLFQGDLTLGLFTAEELMLLSVLIYRQRQLAESGPEPSDEEFSADEAFQAAQQAVQMLNTPERQQHWRARIAQQLEAGEELSGPMQAALFLFHKTLTEPVEDEALMPLLIAAYLGEFRLQQERAESDPALSKELEEASTRILERLERGEPPLVQAPSR